ncbi:MAG: hypothetical protein ACJA2M_002600 [Polaribacter sp.]|jgi:hypothetical protein
MKHLVKTLTCLILVLVANSCQKDDTPILQEETQIESLNAFNLDSREIPSHILDFVKTKTNNNFGVSIVKNKVKLSSSEVNEFSRETPLGIVQTNKVVQVYNERNTKYTFKVSNPTNSNSVINLVVVDMDGDIIEYFIQYIFDSTISIPRTPSGAIDMTRFTGGMTFYDMDGLIIGNFILDDGSLIENNGDIDPCPEDIVEDETDDNNNNNSNTSGGGNNNTNTGNDNDDPDSNGDTTSSGHGEFVDPDQDKPCGMDFYYGNCGCADEDLPTMTGHEPSGRPCCGGTPLVAIDTCTGDTWSSAGRGLSSTSSPCDGDVGVIIELENLVVKKQDLADCLQESYNQEWFNENFDYNDINLIHEFLIDSNNCDSSSISAINTIIDLMTANPTSQFEDFILEINADPEKKIDNIIEELECFDKTLPAKLTIYAEQCIENSREVTSRLGHTFIGIEQDGVVRNIGFYPDNSGAANLLGPQGGELHNNSSSPYHISISADIDSNQLTNIINYIENYSSSYDLNNYNCTDFGIVTASLGGINSPRTIGTKSEWGFTVFEGANPSDLGEDMREFTLPLGATRDDEGGNAPERSDDC